MTTPRQAFGGGVAVITGAASGIGAGLARRAAKLDMRLVLADWAGDRLAEVADALRADGAWVLPVQTDVSDIAAVERLAERAWTEAGPVRLLVNNAGVETTGYLWDIPPERFDRQMKVNLYGVYNGIRAFMPRLLAQGDKAYVANVASVGALTAIAFQAPYIASKHAVQALSECLHVELQTIGAPIAVSSVLPGAVQTRIFIDALADDSATEAHGTGHREDMRAHLANTGMTPDDAAEAILAGIAAEKFWVFTDQAVGDRFIQRRAEALASQAAPKVPSFAVRR